MRLLIIGVGDPIPTFIKRRLIAISMRSVELVVAMSYGQNNPLPGSIQIVRYGNHRGMVTSNYLRLVWLVLTRPNLVVRVYRGLGSRTTKARAKLTLAYLPLASLKDIDLIHIQWLGWVPDLYWLRGILESPIVASARGSQITVYPYTRPGYVEVILKALRLADSCHFVSDDLRKVVLKLGANDAKLFVNYNGIDLDRFKPLPKRQNFEAVKSLQLVSVGALIWRKGYLFQIELVRQLTRRNVNVQLTIVGDGVDREGLMYACKALDVEGFVLFKGQMSELEVASLLAKSDVYISTSMAEGLPNSVVEAAACALPVVAFECEGIHEVVEHGVSGYVVPPGMIDEMAKFVEVLQNYECRSTMGQRAREVVQEKFQQANCVEEMIVNYQRVIDEFQS